MAAYRFAYISLVIFAAVFSQVYSGHLSSVILLTFLILPVVSLLLTLLELVFFKLRISDAAYIVEKGENLILQITASNMSFLPISCVYVTASLPNVEGKNEARLFFSLGPFQKRVLNISYSPAFRGEYEFSADRVYFYDIFKLFKLKKSYNIKNNILVTPKIYDIGAGQGRSAETDEETFVPSGDFSGGERSFVRKYTDGDEIKRIHWKLSSKQEEYMVWQSVKNQASQVNIICDMTKHGENETENAFYSDAVIETALAICLFNLRRERFGMLTYYDAENKISEVIPVLDIGSLCEAAETSAKIKSYHGDPDFFQLAKESFGNDNGNSDVILITHRGDQRLAQLTEMLTVTEGFSLVLIGKAEDEIEEYIKKFKNIRYAAIRPENFSNEILKAISNIYGE